MFVENWMTPDPLTVAPALSISAAAQLMGRHKFRHLLISQLAEQQRMEILDAMSFHDHKLKNKIFSASSSSDNSTLSSDLGFW